MSAQTETQQPIYSVGDQIEFGSEATNHFIHDALLVFNYEWDAKKLRALSGSSLFMSTAERIMRTPAEHRSAHEHVLAKIYQAVNRELEKT